MIKRHTEVLLFRLIQLECCGHFLRWIEPRLPSYCPECGKPCYPQVRSWMTIRDEGAILSYQTRTKKKESKLD